MQKGKGLVKVNGKPLALIQPEVLRFKVTPIKSFSLHEAVKLTLSLRSMSLSSLLALINSPVWIFESELKVVVIRRRFTPLDRQLLSQLWLTIKNLWTNTRRINSNRRWFSMIGLCWWRIADGVNRRSLVGQAQERDIKSHIVRCEVQEG